MGNVKITIPKPHGPIQSKIVNFFIDPEYHECQELVVACGTKFGKTFGAGGSLVLAAPRLNQSNWRWLAPYYSQSQIGFNLVQKLLPQEFIDPKRSTLEIEIPTNKIHLGFIHGQNAVQLEGHEIHGYVFDECAKLHEDVYTSARTTTTKTRSIGYGKMLLISTPFGRNWFYRKAMEAQEEELRAKREKRRPRMIFLTAPTRANPFIDKKIIEEARASIPERLFEQYYEARFVDATTVFGTAPYECMYGSEAYFQSDRFGELISKNSATRTVVIGADWARGSSAGHDATVFTAIDYNVSPMKVVGMQRSRGLNITEQIKNLVRFASKFEECTKVIHDKTGIGLAFDDQLQMTNLPFHGISFTVERKAELVTKLMTNWEQKLILVPNLVELKHEIKFYSCEITRTGLMKFGAGENQTDDILTSLMLANIAASEYAGIDEKFKFLEDVPSMKDPLRNYYDELIEDEEYSEMLHPSANIMEAIAREGYFDKK